MGQVMNLSQKCLGTAQLLPLGQGEDKYLVGVLPDLGYNFP